VRRGAHSAAAAARWELRRCVGNTGKQRNKGAAGSTLVAHLQPGFLQHHNAFIDLHKTWTSSE
jgi:hypothetical protein